MKVKIYMDYAWLLFGIILKQRNVQYVILHSDNTYVWDHLGSTEA